MRALDWSWQRYCPHCLHPSAKGIFVIHPPRVASWQYCIVRTESELWFSNFEHSTSPPPPSSVTARCRRRSRSRSRVSPPNTRIPTRARPRLIPFPHHSNAGVASLLRLLPREGRSPKRGGREHRIEEHDHAAAAGQGEEGLLLPALLGPLPLPLQVAARAGREPLPWSLPLPRFGWRCEVRLNE